jgi:hypothetical protein
MMIYGKTAAVKKYPYENILPGGAVRRNAFVSAWIWLQLAKTRRILHNLCIAPGTDMYSGYD